MFLSNQSKNYDMHFNWNKDMYLLIIDWILHGTFSNTQWIFSTSF